MTGAGFRCQVLELHALLEGEAHGLANQFMGIPKRHPVLDQQVGEVRGVEEPHLASRAAAFLAGRGRIARASSIVPGRSPGKA